MGKFGLWRKAAKISNKIGFTNICYKLNKNRKRIIAYHNVIPDKYFDNTIHLAHSIREASFKKQLDVISRRFSFGTDINSPSEITLTFDDGYLNQYSVAYKIMNQRGINGYFFCAADLLRGKEILTIDKLQYWFSYVPTGEYNFTLLNNSIYINISDKQSRITEKEKIFSLFKLGFDMEDIEKALNKIYAFSGITEIDMEYYRLRFTPILVHQIDEMKENRQLVGAHSAGHNNMAALSEDKLQDDISICRKLLGSVYNTDIFCFPFGGEHNVSQKVIDEVEKQRFSSAISYINRPLKNGTKYHRYFIPRMVLPDTDEDDLIDFILSGAMYFCLYRKLLPKWEG